MQKSELMNSLNLDPTAFNKLVQFLELGVKDEYSEEEVNKAVAAVKTNKPAKRNTQQSQPSGSIVVTAKERTALSKRKAVEQAAQDAAIANRAYAETYLTVLNHGAEEFIQSLTQHSDGLRESLSEVEDDADFLSQLMANGCGGALPS